MDTEGIASLLLVHADDANSHVLDCVHASWPLRESCNLPTTGSTVTLTIRDAVWELLADRAVATPLNSITLTLLSPAQWDAASRTILIAALRAIAYEHAQSVYSSPMGLQVSHFSPSLPLNPVKVFTSLSSVFNSSCFSCLTSILSSFSHDQYNTWKVAIAMRKFRATGRPMPPFL